MDNKGTEVIVIVGPTASGKSDFAVELALKCDGEIISSDSRQIYKGLDIGTGKITTEEMKGVKHHMLSVYNLDTDVSVASYARDATSILKDIISRGKTPIICGGTGQYIDALIFDTKIPEVKPNKSLRETLEKLPTEDLVTRLEKADPTRLMAIDKHNRVRLIRALEISDVLGAVPPQGNPELLYETKIYLMDIPRDLLLKRITRRLLKRLDSGMIDEVRSVKEKGFSAEDMRRFGIEYEIIGKYLEGRFSEEEMKNEIITKSMQYAKRQQTWNKKYTRDYREITTEIKVE